MASQGTDLPQQPFKPFEKRGGEHTRQTRLGARPFYESLYDLVSSIRDLDQVVAPVVVYFRGVEIRIIEVSKIELPTGPQYIVEVQLKYKDVRSRVFPIFCRNIEDFVEKLRMEVMKFRIFLHVLPDVVQPQKL